MFMIFDGILFSLHSKPLYGGYYYFTLKLFYLN